MARRTNARKAAPASVMGRQQSSGSGFVIDPEGYIITNAHVVNGAQRVQIVLPADNADGTLATALSSRTRLIGASIVGITTELDLAVLKVEGLKLPALHAGDLHASPAGRDGVCVRQPQRAPQQFDPRAGLGRGPTGGPRLPADLRADRCADQSRQFGRPSGQHPRGSGRRQHVHHVAIRRERGPGLRHSERNRTNGVPPIPAIWLPAPAGSGHEHPDGHAGDGRSARTDERLRRHRVRCVARRSGRGCRSGRGRRPDFRGRPARRRHDSLPDTRERGLDTAVAESSAAGHRTFHR